MTNSKKIKRNIGASRRLAPFRHVRSITFTIILLSVVLIFGRRKASTSPEPTPPPYNPTVFTASGKADKTIKVIEESGSIKTNQNATINFDASTGYSAKLIGVSENKTLALTTEHFAFNNNELSISDAGTTFIKDNGSSITAGSADAVIEYTLTFKVTSTASGVEPQSVDVSIPVKVSKAKSLGQTELDAFIKETKTIKEDGTSYNNYMVVDGMQFTFNTISTTTPHISSSSSEDSKTAKLSNVEKEFIKSLITDNSKNKSESYFTEVVTTTKSSVEAQKVSIHLKFILGDRYALADNYKFMAENVDIELKTTGSGSSFTTD